MIEKEQLKQILYDPDLAKNILVYQNIIIYILLNQLVCLLMN